MLIILEGCDGTGKTTLAEMLAKKYNAHLIHFGADIAKNPRAFAIFQSFILRSRQENVVIDRFFHGQFVYQEEGERVLSYDDLRLLEEMIMISGNYRMILVEASPSVILKRVAERGESTKDFNPRKIMKKYRKLRNERSILKWTTIVGEGEPDVSSL